MRDFCKGLESETNEEVKETLFSVMVSTEVTRSDVPCAET